MIRLNILFLVFILFSCKKEKSVDLKYLKGAWQSDSLYNFSNGYVFGKKIIKNDDNTIFEYSDNNILYMRKYGEKRRFIYQILDRDSLIYVDTNQTFISGYKIIELTNERLVLKKRQPFLFPGKNQNRYDIRIFSRVPNETKH